MRVYWPRWSKEGSPVAQNPPEEGGRKDTMAQGTVKWFSQDKGYGFITPDEGGEDIFVHYTGIAGSGFRSLEEGERVSYEPTRGRKGEQAENVRKVFHPSA